YETGVTVPAEVVLGFIEQTGANPIYLFTGEGPRFGRPAAERPVPELSPIELIRRGLERLERTSDSADGASPGDLSADHAGVGVHPLERIGKEKLAGSASEGQIMALRQWIATPSQTIAVRLIDEAMHPILPAGSIVAIDRSVTDPRDLHEGI